ncbi:MAG: phosphate uptake regulator PhoU [Candidatus Bathyarchaeota archaeon]|nr:phosphate uptake regulator PhoU [Candidatus Bathyarchaeota archaeon]
MHRLLDKGLEQLTTVVFKMGEVAQKALSISVGGYVRGNDTSETVRELSEILVMMTAEVEEKSFSLIAKYQPVASDLRIINSYMKIAYDFERYGRYAWDITFSRKCLGGTGKCEGWMQDFIRDMGEKVLLMVKTSVDSLKRLDTELAKTLTKTEQEVDDMYLQYLGKLAKEERLMDSCTISSLLVVRYLERIADHATYVAEAVVYVASGEKVTLR